MALIIDGAKDQNGNSWTYSWWNPHAFQITFTIKNTGNSGVYLGTFRWAMVSGYTPPGVTISEYGHGYSGAGGTLALYQGANKISSDITIEATSAPNLAQFSGGNPVPIAANTGAYSNNSVFFVPRYREGTGNIEIANVPDSAHDSVSKVTRKINITSDILVPAGGKVDITIKSNDSYSGYRVFQVSPISQAEVLPKHKVTWVPNGGTISGQSANTSKIVTVIDGNSASGPTISRTDYRFTGWKSSDSSSYANISSMNGEATNVTQDRTYTAQWEPATSKVDFYRNFDASDTQHNIGTGQIGSKVGSTENTISSSITNDSGTYSTLKEQVEANIRQDTSAGGKCSGYKFWHWRRTNDIHTISSNPSTLPSYVSLNAVNINSNAVENKFYAVWQAKSGKVTFYRNYSDSDMEIVDGGEISNVDYVTSTLGSTKPANPDRPGVYRFKGWSTSRQGNVEADSLVLWDKNSGKAIDTFYAIWEKIYTVYVRENGKWVKKLNVRKYNAATKTWDELVPKQRAKGSWDDKL